ncbi:MAG: PadR family transcriptional regulator [Lachnospiraceae bacterium]|nr:PadR family transcriptional regulator [Lachnospiraceae bacterium]
MNAEKDLIDILTLELRRGTLVLSVLNQLNNAQYGYSLVQMLEEKGITIDPSTLYPLLRRLEKQGLLTSKWDMGESKPRKYYSRTEYGDEVYKKLKGQWSIITKEMSRLLEE